MKISKPGRIPWVLVFLLPVLIGGCRQREPIGGCPYEDVELSSDFVMPWGTTLEEDIAQLAGSYEGTLAWEDGEDVILVPKAGEEIEVEARVEIERSTVRMREYQSTEQTPVCEIDYVFMEAVVSFIRLDDGEVELSAPVTVARYDDQARYYGDARELPVAEFSSELTPQEDFQTEEIWVQAVWPEDGSFCAAYDYYGSSSDPSSGGASTGHGVTQKIAAFTMPSSPEYCP